MTASDLAKVTLDIFDEYRVSAYNPDGPIVSQSSFILSHPTLNNKADHFKKSINQDKSQHAMLMEDKQQDK